MATSIQPEAADIAAVCRDHLAGALVVREAVEDERHAALRAEAADGARHVGDVVQHRAEADRGARDVGVVRVGPPFDASGPRRAFVLILSPGPVRPQVLPLSRLCPWEETSPRQLALVSAVFRAKIVARAVTVPP